MIGQAANGLYRCGWSRGAGVRPLNRCEGIGAYQALCTGVNLDRSIRVRAAPSSALYNSCTAAAA
jgi:hypothetical protein